MVHLCFLFLTHVFSSFSSTAFYSCKPTNINQKTLTILSWVLVFFFSFDVLVAVRLLQATFKLWLYFHQCNKLARNNSPSSISICKGPWLCTLEQCSHWALLQLHFLQGWGASRLEAGLAKGSHCKHHHACVPHCHLLHWLLCLPQQQKRWRWRFFQWWPLWKTKPQILNTSIISEMVDSKSEL